MDIIDLLATNNFIIYNKDIAKKYGIEAAILLGAMCSYQKSFKNQEFYRDENEITNDTALSIYAIRKAKQVLKNAGILQIVKKGLPARHFFKINAEKLLVNFTNQITTTTSNQMTTSSGYQIATTRDSQIATTYNKYNNIDNNKNNINKKIYKKSSKIESKNGDRNWVNYYDIATTESKPITNEQF